jgi:hypothetical protein
MRAGRIFRVIAILAIPGMTMNAAAASAPSTPC